MPGKNTTDQTSPILTPIKHRGQGNAKNGESTLSEDLIDAGRSELKKKNKKKKKQNVKNNDEVMANVEIGELNGKPKKKCKREKRNIDVANDGDEANVKKKKKRKTENAAEEKMEQALGEESVTNTDAPKKKKKKKMLREQKTDEDAEKTVEGAPEVSPMKKEQDKKKEEEEREKKKKKRATERNRRKKMKAKLKKARIKKLKQKVTGMKEEDVAGFTVVKDSKPVAQQRLQRRLPHWLANPTTVARDLHADCAPVDAIRGLDENLKKLLKEDKIENLFPVQKTVIPELLASNSSLAVRYRPRDVCVSAPTGSGKTLVYVLTIIQALKERAVCRIRAVVLLPAMELAHQVSQVFKRYVTGTDLRVELASTTTPFEKEQKKLVKEEYGGYVSAVDILVATPGRLFAHMKNTKGFDLSHLRYLVLDEGDRILKADGGNWVSTIEKALRSFDDASENATVAGGIQESGPTLFPRMPLQRLLCSATLSHDPETLQKLSLYRPKLFLVRSTERADLTREQKRLLKSDPYSDSPYGLIARPAELSEEYAMVEREVKPLVLYHLIKTRSWRRTIVFTNSVQSTHKLSVLLGFMFEDLRVGELSAHLDSKRRQVVRQFEVGKIDILVASDVIARGMDFTDVDHVVCYDVTSEKTYVHRIGRTARAGKEGTALSLVTQDKEKRFKTGLFKGGTKFSEVAVQMEDLEPYQDLYVAALTNLRNFTREESKKRFQATTKWDSRKKDKAGGNRVPRVKRLQDRGPKRVR